MIYLNHGLVWSVCCSEQSCTCSRNTSFFIFQACKLFLLSTLNLYLHLKTAISWSHSPLGHSSKVCITIVQKMEGTSSFSRRTPFIAFSSCRETFPIIYSWPSAAAVVVQMRTGSPDHWLKTGRKYGIIDDYEHEPIDTRTYNCTLFKCLGQNTNQHQPIIS